MRVEAFAIRLRRRGNMEAADLGVRLCQSAASSVYRCYIPVALAVSVLALAAIEIAVWLPTLLIWLAKPWLDRTILFVLARAAFGQPTRFAEVWREQRQVWWSQWLGTWTLRRLSPWRSFTSPVHQLEGLSGSKRSRRVAQIRLGRAGSGTLITAAFSLAEFALLIAVVSLVFWFTPPGVELEIADVFREEFGRKFNLITASAYAVVVTFLEPFYVAAGFGLYLNRRVELEAWDIEQEFRRAFSA